MTEKEIAFDKAKAIIESCETCDHFENAQSYLDLFNDKFTDIDDSSLLKRLFHDKKTLLNCHKEI